MSITLTALQKQRRDTAANWTAENPTLLAGEIGLESDTGYWKVGDGATAWTSLAYVSGLGAEIPVNRLADGSARQLLQTAANGTDVEWTSNVDIPGTLDVTGATTFDGSVTVQGDLTVNGTTTTIDTTTLVVEDKNIEIGKVATPSDVTADGGGLTLKGSTDKTINWVDATDAWTFSEHVDLASTKEYRIAGTKVIDATSLGSAVVSSSLTSVGTITTGVWNGTTVATGYGGTGQSAYTDGELLIGKTDGTLAKTTLTAGSNVTITNGDGTISIASTDTNTTYTAGDGLDLVGTEFSADLKANGGIVIETGELGIDLGATSITGTLATGDGGTGQTTYTDGQLLIGKTDGTLAKATLTAGTGITITNGDGAVTVTGTGGTVTAVTGTSPIASTGGTTPDISIQDGTTTQKGAVQLEDSTSSTSTTTAATPNSVKSAYDLANAALPASGGTVTGDVTLNAQSDLRFADSDSSNWVAFQGPATVASNVTWTLPDADGTSGQVLSTNGSGALSWATESIADKIEEGNTSAEVIDTGSDGRFVVTTEGSERARVDSSGRLLVGTSSAASNIQTVDPNYGAPTQQIASTNQFGAHLAILRFSDSDAAGSYLSLTKSYTNTLGTDVLVPNDSLIGRINFQANDGTNYLTAARVEAYTDGATGTNDMPGRLVFSTTADGSSSPTERMRIDNDGNVGIGRAPVAAFDVYRASGTVRAVIDSDSLADLESAVVTINGGARSTQLGVYKHSGITNPASYMLMRAEDNQSNYFWVDNSDQFRISTTSSNIGTTSGTVVGTQTSDERLKNIIGPVEYGLDTLKQIEPVRFSLKSEPETEKLGFIAQQVQSIVPQSVFDTGEHIEGEPEDAPTKLGMEYVALIPVLVNAVKELSAEVDALRAQLQA